MEPVDEDSEAGAQSNPPGRASKACLAPAGIVTALASLPADSVLDTSALAAALGRSKKSVQRAVRRGELPPPFKFLGKNCWLLSAILTHLQSQQAAALAQAARHAKSREEHSI